MILCVAVFCALIDVDADEVHYVVAGVILLVMLHCLGLVCKVGRVSPDDVGASATHHIVMRIAIKLLILFRGAASFAPPEPSSAHFVPRTEDDWHLLSVSSLQRENEVSNLTQP